MVTNDFVIADYLLDNSNCTIIHTGGAVCRENRSCVGEAAATMLRSLMIDQALFLHRHGVCGDFYASGR